MADLLDGMTVPWYAVSGVNESAATVLPEPARREGDGSPMPGRRLVAGGVFVAGALAAHWLRGRS